MKLLVSTGETLRGTLRPVPFFSSGTASRMQTIVEGAAGVLLGGTLLLVLTALVNARAIAEANANVAAILRGGVALYNNPGWSGRLLFPVYFIVLFAVWSAVRFGLLSILAVERRSFAAIASVSVLALLPLAVSGVVQGVFNNLFPVLPSLEDTILPRIRVYGALLMTLGVFVWEGVIVIRGCEEVFSLNRGTAVLMWLAPYVTLVLLFVLVMTLLSLFS